MPRKLWPLTLAILAACSTGSTEPTVYSVLVSPSLSPLYGPDLWRATDSAAPASWSAPSQGWHTLDGSWCIHVPTAEAVVAVTDSQPGGGLALPKGWVGYLHLSAGAASWIARDSIGKVAFSPSPPC